MSLHSDHEAYWKFTGPMQLDKAIHTLQGILAGIGMDGQVSSAEVETLVEWLELHDEMRNRHPFNEFIPALRHALQDNHVDAEELADLQWLCNRVDPSQGYYDGITSDMQKLQGVLGGIVADGQVSDEEVAGLIKWMEDHEHLRRCWPFDEIQSLLLEVAKDKKIDERERQLLLTFFSEWTTVRGNQSLSFPLNEVNTPITGLCAALTCPH